MFGHTGIKHCKHLSHPGFVWGRFTGVHISRLRRIDDPDGAGRWLRVGSARRVCLNSGQNASPLGAHGRVAYAVETEDEQTLQVDENHE